MNNEAWKRVPLWIAILILSSVVFMGWKDYHYMDTQMRLMKQNFVEDVVGYGFCDKD